MKEISVTYITEEEHVNRLVDKYFNAEERSRDRREFQTPPTRVTVIAHNTAALCHSMVIDRNANSSFNFTKEVRS